MKGEDNRSAVFRTVICLKNNLALISPNLPSRKTKRKITQYYALVPNQQTNQFRISKIPKLSFIKPCKWSFGHIVSTRKDLQ